MKEHEMHRNVILIYFSDLVLHYENFVDFQESNTCYKLYKRFLTGTQPDANLSFVYF